MAVNKIPEFAKNGQKNTDNLNQEDGFPVNLKPARQWFNFLFNQLALSINQIIDENYIRHNELIDNLTTNDDTKPLTAKQGKALQDNKLDKTTNAVGILAFENRTLKPTQLKSSSVQAVFGTLNSDSSTQYADFLTLNSWNDPTGGSKNALVFSKTTQELFHYQATYDSQTWEIKKKIAYTDSDISGNATTSTKLKTSRKINLIDFDGTQDINIEAPLRYLGNITTSAQLDSTVTDGKYTVVELNVAGLYGYGFLVVLRSGGVCCQIYYPHLAGGANNGTLAIRQSWNTNGNGATWSDWRVIGTRDDSKLPLSGGTVDGDLRVNGLAYIKRIRGNEDLWITDETEQNGRRVLTGGILASNSYNEAPLVPHLGIYSKGHIYTSSDVCSDTYRGYASTAKFTGNLDGKLLNARMINGVAFDASQDIKIPPVSFLIPDGSDLNNYQSTGFYYQTTDASAKLISNVPQQNAFSLRVEQSAGCSQWFTPYAGCGVTYYRYFYSGFWSEWVKIDPNNITGNASTATKLQTARNIALSGAVTGEADFDGSGNITIPTTLNGFESLKSENGYSKIPQADGSTLIMQWCTVQVGKVSTATKSFPLVFPNAVLSASLSQRGRGNGGNTLSIDSFTTSGVQVYNGDASTSNIVTAMIFAIGY